jgi:hypothetical protein
LGTITQVTQRSERAMRKARSIACRIERGGRHRRHVAVRHVLEERLEIDLLLIIPPEGGGGRLADDGDHRLVIERRIVEAVQEVDRARARSGDAHARLTCELGVGRRHEGGHLCVAHLDEARLALGAIERRHDPVDAVARIAEEALDPPSPQAPDQIVTDRACHRRNLFL